MVYDVDQSRTRYLATCSADTTVKIWSIGRNWDFKLEKVLQGHQRWVWDCAFSADSAYLVTGAESAFWSTQAGTASWCCFSASSDHVARLWEMATGETVRQYNGHHKGVYSASFLTFPVHGLLVLMRVLSILSCSMLCLT